MHNKRIGWLAVVASALLAPMLFAATMVSAQDATDDPAQLEAGKAVYEASCAGCHGLSGEGSDAGRPLTGIAEQQPDRAVHIRSVTEGKGGMPAFADALSGEEIDAAVSYVRLSFSNDATDSDEELPRTGTSSNLLGFSVLLCGAGFGLIGLARRLYPAQI